MTFPSDVADAHEKGIRRFVRAALVYEDPDEPYTFPAITSGPYAHIIGEERDMARKASTKKNAPVVESVLSNHLRFLSLATADNEEIWKAHLNFGDNTIIAFNGVLTAGMMVDHNHIIPNVAPHAASLMRALDRVGDEFAMTVEESRMTIKGGRLTVNVPLLPAGDLYGAGPDPYGGPCDMSVVEAMKACAHFASDAAPTVVVASVLVRAGSCVGTDRHVLLQHNHGAFFPADLPVPKEFVKAIAKSGKTVVGAGVTPGVSLTLFFDDNSFLKTQLYSEPWPDNWEEMLPSGEAADWVKPPPSFWEAFDAVKGFTDGTVFAEGEKLRSHESPSEGAVYEMPGMRMQFGVNFKRLEMVRAYMDKFGIIREGVIGFYTDYARGIIALDNRGQPGQ